MSQPLLLPDKSTTVLDHGRSYDVATPDGTATIVVPPAPPPGAPAKSWVDWLLGVLKAVGIAMLAAAVGAFTAGIRSPVVVATATPPVAPVSSAPQVAPVAPAPPTRAQAEADARFDAAIKRLERAANR